MEPIENRAYEKVLDLTRSDSAALQVQGTLSRGVLALPECKQESDIAIRFEVSRSTIGEATEFQLTGEVGVEVSVPCVRCLSPVRLSLIGQILRRFLPGSLRPEEDADHQILDGEADIEYYERPVFDIEALIREQIYLELPMDPLCRPDCSGLCPRCGADRNLVKCECNLAVPDPRLAVLGRLLPDA